MNDFIIHFCIAGCCVGIALGLIRVARGPTVLDRILAFDLIATLAVAIIALLSMIWETSDYVELILIYTLLGFSGATAFTFYLQRAYDPQAGGDEDPARTRGGDEP